VRAANTSFRIGLNAVDAASNFAPDGAGIVAVPPSAPKKRVSTPRPYQ
jgi:hypothetical protein